MNVRIIWQFGGVTTVLEDFGPISPSDYTISNIHHWLSRHDYWSIKKCCEGSIMLIIGIYYGKSEEKMKKKICIKCGKEISEKESCIEYAPVNQEDEDVLLPAIAFEHARDCEEEDEKELREFTDQAAVELHKRMLEDEKE